MRAATWLRAAAALLAAIALHTGPLSDAGARDVSPTVVTRMRVGQAAGAGAMPRGDVGRTGRVTRLPAEPVLLHRTQLAGGLDVGVAIEASGTIHAATGGGHLVTLDAAGKELGRTTLGSGGAVTPLLDGSGEVRVITAAGDLVAARPTSGVRWSTRVASRGKEVRTAPLPTVGGGVVVAAETSLLHVDETGRVLARASLPDVVAGAIVAGGRGEILVTTGLGRVFAWDLAREPRLVGQLGGLPTSGAAIASRTLVVVVDAARVVAMDVTTGATRTLFTTAALLEGPVALDVRGTAWVESAAGVLFGVPLDGAEVSRFALPSPGAGAHEGGIGGTGPAPFVDAEGRVALVRPTGEVVVVSKGAARVAEARACSEPIATSAIDDRFVVACRDGSIAVYGAGSGGTVPDDAHAR